MGEGKRIRKPTEKGQTYVVDVRQKKISSTFRSLRKTFDKISDIIEKEVIDRDIVEEVRSLYKEWLDEYDDLFQIRIELVGLLVDQVDIEQFEREGQAQDKELRVMKFNIDKFFLENESRSKTEDRELLTTRSVASVSDYGSSKSSNASSARLREKQTQAELFAKRQALENKRKLEFEKLELKMREDELELETQLKVTEARLQAINEFEDEQPVTSTPIVQKKFENKSEEQDRKPTVRSSPTPHPVQENIEPTNRQRRQTRDFKLPDSRMTPDSRMEPDSRVPPDSRNESDGRMETVVRQLRMPVPEIKKFGGNPSEYSKFTRQFRVKIVANTDTDDERLNYLEQFTTGEAHEIVSGHSYLDSEVGYKAALKELEERYGDNQVIAQAFIQRALDWSNIKPDDSKALDQYAIFLSECQHAVASIQAVKVLEYPDNVRRWVAKLPFYMHDKWRNEVLKIRTLHKNITFTQFVDFVKREARKVNDPVFGRAAMKPDQSRARSSSTKKVRTSNATGIASQGNEKTDTLKNPAARPTPNQSTEKQPLKKSQCPFCSGYHPLQHCEKIASLQHVEKIEFLRSKGICFRCLSHGHISSQCNEEIKCRLCGNRHQTILHIKRDQQTKKKEYRSSRPGVANMSSAVEECDTTMAIIPVKVRMKDKVTAVETYAFLDPGSSISFCSESLLEKLGCQGKPMKVTIETMGSPHTMDTSIVQGLMVSDLSNEHEIQLPPLYTKDSLPVSRSHIPISADVSHYPHLSDIDLPQLDSSIELLIGNNLPDAYTPLQVRTGEQGTPHATKSRLGWILWNVVRNAEHEHENCGLAVMRTEVMKIKESENMRELDQLLRQSMNIEFPENGVEDRKELSQEDKMFLDKVDRSIELKDGHYHIKLPLRDEDVEMPENHDYALKRLSSLKKKFEKNDKFYKDYTKFMENVISKGYAEKVPEDELQGPKGKTWFIPHHGVYHPRKPDKIRVVFDCAAKYQGVSLNDVLLQGPDLTNNLTGVLIKFRQEPVAITGDIEAMYYQVKVHTEDKDFQRFYWWENADYSQKPRVYRMNVHLFGTVSSSSCATYALRKTAEENKNEFEPGITSMINENFYVDDCLSSTESDDAAIKQVKGITNLCSKGGFHIAKWASNSRKVIESIPEESRAGNMKSLDLEQDDLPCERVLGTYWILEEDKLSFKIKLKDHSQTKRGILSVTSSVYDPLGFAAPVILPAKQLLQTLCRENLSWDEPVPDQLLVKWERWLCELSQIEKLKIECCYKPHDFGPITDCQFHLFSDASDVGYGVVAYLRLENEKNEVYCSFVMAKSRVAPLSKVTVPRMELTAATTAAWMSKVIERDLQYEITRTAFWTDSMSVIRYVTNETTRFHTFVANRVTTIREASNPEQWHFIRTKLNPADIASRGATMTKFLSTDRWTKGPEFLWLPESMWPTEEIQTEIRTMILK